MTSRVAKSHPSETGEKTKSPGGQQTSTKGQSGAGEQPGENQGAPDSKEGMKPADKRQQSPSQESKTDDKEPPAPGEGKRESDSQGETGGDRPGGGEEGGGQKAEPRRHRQRRPESIGRRGRRRVVGKRRGQQFAERGTGCKGRSTHGATGIGKSRAREQAARWSRE